MIQNKITVSIGMPVFNDKLYLNQSLGSLLQQTYSNFELIISDDGSTDGSEDICREYAQKDNRIVYIRQNKTLGISKNMEFLLKKARGEYFMWAADDDLWNKEFIERLLHGLRASPDAIVAFCPYIFIDTNNNILQEYPVRAVNYKSQSILRRLIMLTQKWDDGFGYGLFIREKIKNVKFPVWWWINNKCAYNNIYPTLYFYLTKGNFAFVDGDPLWLNRLKPQERINHNIPFDNTFLRGLFAYSLRRINLFYKCIQSILLVNPLKSYIAIILFPFMVKKLLGDIKGYLFTGLKLYHKGYKSLW